MEVILCTCDGLPAHQHTSETQRVRMLDGREVTMPTLTVGMNSSLIAEVLETYPSDIKLAVDWKQVARDLALADGT